MLLLLPDPLFWHAFILFGSTVCVACVNKVYFPIKAAIQFAYMYQLRESVEENVI